LNVSTSYNKAQSVSECCCCSSDKHYCAPCAVLGGLCMTIRVRLSLKS